MHATFRPLVRRSFLAVTRLASACAALLFVVASDAWAAPLVTVTATDCHVATMRIFSGGYLLASPSLAPGTITIDGVSDSGSVVLDALVDFECAEGPVTIHKANYAPFLLSQLHTAIHLDRPFKTVTYVEQPFEIDCSGVASETLGDDCVDVVTYFNLPLSGTWNTMVGYSL